MRIRPFIGFLAALASATGPIGPALAQPSGDHEGTAALVGKVLGLDGKPLGGATILAYHLSSEQSHRAAATRGNGEFSIEGLPYGYYDVAVEVGQDLYVGRRVLNLAPGSKTAIVLELSSAGLDPSSMRDHPGSDLETRGVAEVRRRLRGREFWRSPRGVAILVGGVGVGFLAAASSGNDETPASPF